MAILFTDVDFLSLILLVELYCGLVSDIFWPEADLWKLLVVFLEELLLICLAERVVAVLFLIVCVRCRRLAKYLNLNFNII